MREDSSIVAWLEKIRRGEVGVVAWLEFLQSVRCHSSSLITASSLFIKAFSGYRGQAGFVAWIKFLMSFPQKREPREYLSELYSKFLYNFTYFKCFFWIPAFAGMTSNTFLDPCNNAGYCTIRKYYS